MNNKNTQIKDYIKFRGLTNRGRALKDVENHIKYFLESSKKNIDDFDESMLINYIQSIKDKYTTTMLNTVKSSYLKPFIKWNFEDWSSRFRNLDKILRTEKANTKYTPNDMITEEEFESMIKEEESVFWKAYFLTLFYGGCRPTEVCNLQRKNVEFTEDGAYITIYSGKNNENFIKYLPIKVADYLKLIYDKGHDFVFFNERTNKPLTVKGAYFEIKKLSKKALDKPIDLYTLRHSIATIIYNNDNIKDDVNARQMGHTKSMKGKYVHNHKDKLKEQAKKIYMDIDNLPEERKHELELKVDEQGEQILALTKLLNEELAEIRSEHKLKVQKEIKEMAKKIK